MNTPLLLLEYQPSALAPTKPSRDEANRRKLEILEAIGEHLREHGRKDWDRVREKPEFAPYVGRQAGEAGRRKFFRWVRDVVRVTPNDTTRPHEARVANEKHMAWAEANAADAQVEHPDIAIPAAFIAKMGVDGRRRINIEALARQTLEDIGRLRQAAFVKDPTAPGGERVQDVALLERAVARSTKFLDTYERVGDRLWDIESYERNFAVLVDILTHDVPEDKMLPTMKRLKKLIDHRTLIGDPDDGLRTSPDGKVTPPVSLDDVPPATSDVPAPSPIQ